MAKTLIDRASNTSSNTLQRPSSLIGTRSGLKTAVWREQMCGRRGLSCSRLGVSQLGHPCVPPTVTWPIPLTWPHLFSLRTLSLKSMFLMSWNNCKMVQHAGSHVREIHQYSTSSALFLSDYTTDCFSVSLYWADWLQCCGSIHTLSVLKQRAVHAWHGPQCLLPGASYP